MNSYGSLQQGTNVAGSGIPVNSRIDPPMREGGFQMRLLETNKMLFDAHQMMERIETAIGVSDPDGTSHGTVAGPMNLERLCTELRVGMQQLCERIARLEAQF